MHRQTNHAICHLVCIRQILWCCTLQATIGGELADQWIEIAATQDIRCLHLGIEFITGHAVFLRIHEDREVAVVVLYARHIIEEGNALHWAQCLSVFDSYLMTSLDGCIYLLQVQQTIGATHLVHLTVDTRTNHRGLACKTEILQVVDALLGLLIVHDHRTALNGVIYLGGMETQRGDVTSVKDALAVHLHTEGMGGIVNHLQAILVGDILDSLGIAWLAINMHWHDGGGARGDGCLNLARVEIASGWSMSTKTGLQPFHQMLWVVATKL